MDALEDDTVGLPHGSNLRNRLEMLGTGPGRFYMCYKNQSCQPNMSHDKSQQIRKYLP